MAPSDATQVSSSTGTSPGAGTDDDGGFTPLFDGVSLAGWHSAPRIYGAEYPGGPSILELFDRRGILRPVEPEKHPDRWFVEDGAVVGEQDTPGSGYGGYLVSDQTYAAFGEAHWGVGAQCRCRNIRIKEL